MIAYKFVDGKWKGLVDIEVSIDGEKEIWSPVSVVDISVDVLLDKWEDLVHELSDKEVELYKLKEAYLIAESKIINETDFKSLYGANNQKVRDNHVKSELADMVERKASLQLGIEFIRNYIPLLREVIRSKTNDVQTD
jgi:hypothetical protein